MSFREYSDSCFVASHAFILVILKRRSRGSRKIMNKDIGIDGFTEILMKKYDIGYTTGVFDLFHIGHLNILRKAKEHCKHLIVGVSTDELVESYKHKSPIIPFEERIEIVKAIRYVDEVIPQTSMDKMEAWNKLHYDALFHGSDWRGSSMYNDIEEKLKSVGVDMVFLPHTTGTSSTILSEKLQNM